MLTNGHVIHVSTKLLFKKLRKPGYIYHRSMIREFGKKNFFLGGGSQLSISMKFQKALKQKNGENVISKTIFWKEYHCIQNIFLLRKEKSFTCVSENHEVDGTVFKILEVKN